MGVAFEDFPLTPPNPSIVLQMYLASRHDMNVQRQVTSRADAHLPYYATSTTYLPSTSYASSSHTPQAWPLPPFQQTLALDPYQSTFHVAPVQYDSWQSPSTGAIHPPQQALASPQTISSDTETSTVNESDRSPTRESRLSPVSAEPSKASLRSTENSEIGFDTDVDTLMKTIQFPSDDSRTTVESGHVEAQYGRHYDNDPALQNSRKVLKKHRCGHCGMSFVQRTHLEIHLRKHSGEKPFICKEPGCGQRFSQLGNLKTHERRHTGERPYRCSRCDKSFAQKGNVRAHEKTHQQAKPFECRLDDCWKHFTQLGNLKSHQNKFHTATLRTLTDKFARFSRMDEQQRQSISPQDRELWHYFASLYKNSNKGIKGRGKDRRVARVGCTDGR